MGMMPVGGERSQLQCDLVSWLSQPCPSAASFRPSPSAARQLVGRHTAAGPQRCAGAQEPARAEMEARP